MQSPGTFVIRVNPVIFYCTNCTAQRLCFSCEQGSVDTHVKCRVVCLSMELQITLSSHSPVSLDTVFMAAPLLSVCQESGLPVLRL